jgi:hypothetical protein
MKVKVNWRERKYRRKYLLMLKERYSKKKKKTSKSVVTMQDFQKILKVCQGTMMGPFYFFKITMKSTVFK